MVHSGKQTITIDSTVVFQIMNRVEPEKEPVTISWFMNNTRQVLSHLWIMSE